MFKKKERAVRKDTISGKDMIPGKDMILGKERKARKARKKAEGKEIKVHREQNGNAIQKVSMLSLLNPRNLQMELKQCGHEVSLWKYVRFSLLSFGGMIVFAFVFRLRWTYIIPIFLMALVLLPSVFWFRYKNMYEQKKFEEAKDYTEQLLYSFRRQPKILTALQDTALVFQGKEYGVLRKALDQASSHIQTGTAAENIYKEAFAFVEKEYGCKRVYKAHDFLMKVEEAGGECGGSVDILLLDRNLWIDRIYGLIQGRQRIMANISIGIGLSLLIVGMSIYMVPSSFKVTENAASQMTTMFVLMMDILLWFSVQKAVSGSLLAADADQPFEKVKRAYDLVMHGDQKKRKIRYAVAGASILAAALAAAPSIGLRAAGLLAAFALLLVTQPNRQWKACKKRVAREVEKTFPEWLMSLALQMQTDNVHVSMAKTIPDAPKILREELENFQDSVEKHPDELAPYLNFMQTFHIADITSAMRMLYAMAEFGSESAQEQIQTLVERNTKMMDRAEKLKMEDQMAGLGFTILLPMITGVIKMVVDLALVMFYILSNINGI